MPLEAVAARELDLRILLAISVVLLLLLVKVWMRFREGNLSGTRALMFSAAWIGVGVVVWQPGLTMRLAHALGIGRGADLIVYIAVVVLAYVCFQIFVKIDKLDQQITSLVKEIALLEGMRSEREKRDGR